MTQIELKEWLENHDCYLYKEKKKADGIYYFMRSNVHETKIAVLFPPKNGIYREENVCHICNLMSAPVPDYAAGAQIKLDAVKKDLQGKHK